MTIRERLLRCMRHEPIDRVPVNYLVGRGYHGAHNARTFRRTEPS